MDAVTSQRIAQRFARLSAEQRRAVYQKIVADGLAIGRFPVLPREPSSLATCDASYAQSRQWFLWELDRESDAYHISGALRLEGVLDVEALKASLQALVARHESLRTVFEADEQGQARQRIQAEAVLEIEEPDLSGVPVGQREAQAQHHARQVAKTPFDLTRGPLLRASVLRLGEREHVLVLVMHHIVSDGWSMQIVVQELVEQYRAAVQGTPVSRPALPIQYADYAVWQRQWLEAGERERQLAYWTTQLGDDQPVLQLPTDHPRRNTGGYRAATVAVQLPEALSRALTKQAQASGGTLFMALLAGYQVLLQRHSGQDDIRVGVPIANRHRVETEGVVGFFVNTQVLRAQLEGHLRLDEVLQQAKQAALGAQAHQDLPFEQLVEALQPERSLGTSPLFQVMFNHQRADSSALLGLPGLALSGYALGDQAAQFELTLETSEDEAGRVQASLHYAAELFDEATMQRLAGHYVAVLQALAHQPQTRLDELELLDDAERAQLRRWGENTERYEALPLIHELFEQQVQRAPEATAVLFEEEQVSYGELNRRANRLAHRLIEAGVGAESRVGIAVERSIEMIVGLLGILKAGGAYVPLDPEYPQDRLAYMMEDSGIALLVTQGRVRDRLDVGALPVIDLDQALEGYPDHDPKVTLHEQQLAYVIYTSGSTGRPKGVMVPHGALVHFLRDLQQRPGMAPADVLVAVTSLSFDIAALELYLPLITGARIVLASRAVVRDGEALAALLRRSGATVLQATPAGWRLLLAGWGDAPGPRLKGLCGGEALQPDLAADLVGRGVDLWNLYGPTETTIWSLAGQVAATAPPDLGSPIADTRLHVLDAALREVPAGVIGELYLGGVGLARGYLQRSGLAAERFVANPFSGTGERLYRTGDLVRWAAPGRLEYLGRTDHQVKVRGHRIELGEIEAQLLAQPEVREAIVTAHAGPAGAQLVGYVAPRALQAFDAAALRERLGRSLPEHMVPTAIVAVATLPLNPNGKVDRKALQALALPARASEAPQGPMEQALAAIWQDALGVADIGRDDNFFALGGHSVMALRVVARCRQQHLPVTLQDLLSRPTLRALREAAEHRSANSPPVLLNTPQAQRAPLFCVHPALGTVLGYLPLAAHLDGTRPVYGIACRTLTDPTHRDASLDDMARDYVGALRRVQPTGPYHLLGWSMGGALAVLMAAMLEAQGQAVAWLGLVDPTVPTVHVDLGAGAAWRADYLALLRDLDAGLDPALQVPLDLADPLRSEAALRDWTAALQQQGRFAPAGRYRHVAADDLVRTFLVDRCISRAARNTVRPLPALAGRVTCWWADDALPKAIDALAIQLGAPRLTHHRIEADHAGIVAHPAVLRGVAEALSGLHQR